MFAVTPKRRSQLSPTMRSVIRHPPNNTHCCPPQTPPSPLVSPPTSPKPQGTPTPWLTRPRCSATWKQRGPRTRPSKPRSLRRWRRTSASRPIAATRRKIQVDQAQCEALRVEIARVEAQTELMLGVIEAMGFINMIAAQPTEEMKELRASEHVRRLLEEDREWAQHGRK